MGNDEPTQAQAAVAAPDERALAVRLRLVVMRLQRQLRAQTVAGLTPSLHSALVSVEVHGPLTLGRLATIERVKPPTVTRMVAALERDGLVLREADASDRRLCRVSVTPKGARELQRSRTRKTAYLVERLRHLDAAQLSTLEAALPVLEHLLEGDR